LNGAARFLVIHARAEFAEFARCTNPPSSGEGEYTFTSPKAFTMKMTMQTTMEGKKETMNMEGSGKWLAADCGNVRPMQPPTKK
jgi:hypothetical protein